MNNVIKIGLNYTIHLVFYIIFFLFGTNNSYSQQENVWIFGRNAGIEFNGGIVTPILSNIGLNPPNYGEAAASVCDSNGDLLFYTDGSQVFDRLHNLMPNGSNLTNIISPDGITPTSSTSQGTVIVPDLWEDGKYYIFSLTASTPSLRTISEDGKLYYSIVDMNLNNGLGDVLPSQKGIYLASGLTERMIAITGTSCNYWLVTLSKNGEVKSFEITVNGVNNNPIISAIINAGSISPSGNLAISSDNTKIAVTGNEGLWLANFNNNLGEASSFNILDSNRGFGVCFSPNSTFIYYNQSGGPVQYVCQFDLNAGSLTDIISSKTELISSYSHTHLKLAPNNKIYFQTNFTGGILNPNGFMLSVINNPDQAGINAQPQSSVITLAPGSSMFIGLPNSIPIIANIHLDTIITRYVHFTCKDNEIQISPTHSSGWGYVWSDGNNGIERTIFQSGIYWVKYRVDCQTFIDTFDIGIHNSFKKRITDVFCENIEYNFNGKSLTTSGTYYDTLRTVEGCDSVIILDLVQLPVQPIDISTSPNLSTLCQGDSIQLIANGARDYTWTHNDINAGVGNNIQLRLTDLSINNIVVSGFTPNNCPTTGQLSVEVKPCCNIIMPNAFTPNGDGKNDAFIIPDNQCGRLLIFRIYNRYGQVVFETVNPQQGWNGTHLGQPADLGVYYYQISIALHSGKIEHYKGDVTLFR